MPLILAVGLLGAGAVGGFFAAGAVNQTASIVKWLVVGGIAFGVAKATKVI